MFKRPVCVPKDMMVKKIILKKGHKHNISDIIYSKVKVFVTNFSIPL